jgi:hypothetical protein
MESSLSISKAITAGLLLVNGPVFLLLFGPLAATLYLLEIGYLPSSQIWLAIFAFFSGFVLAWLWWSLSIPKWRLWAYERVSDITALKSAAVTVGLTWPDNHFFARTEIKSRQHAAREQELDSMQDAEDGA